MDALARQELKESSRVMNHTHVLRTFALALLASSMLSGCAAVDRLLNVTQPPPLSQVENPTAQPGYKPVQMPMPAAQPASYNPNSLWRNGSRAFFKDQRAHQIGDLLNVTVVINDKADFNNETQRNQTGSTGSTISDFVGAKALSPQAQKFLPGNLLTANGTSQFDCKGSIQRQESLTTNIAAVVTQVLPNGNLVVEGKQ